MLAFAVVGGILIAFGLMFLFFPKQLLKLTQATNVVIPVDQHIFKHRYLVGGILVVSSILMYYVSTALSGIDNLLSGLTLALGAIILLFAIILIFVPRLVEKMNEVGGKVIGTDEVTLVYRKTSGAILILVGLYMFYVWWQ